MGKTRRLGLFLDGSNGAFLDRTEILQSLEAYISHCSEAEHEEPWSPEQAAKIAELCRQFYTRLSGMELPSMRRCRGWFYTYSLTGDGIILQWCQCGDTEFDEMGTMVSRDYTVRATLLEEKCRYLTPERFALQCGVTTRTVSNWLRKGKLRTARREGGGWSIPEIAGKPGRSMGFASYFWDHPSPELKRKYSFLADCTTLTVFPSKEGRGRYTVFWGGQNGWTGQAELVERERAELERALISEPGIQVETNESCILYCPDLPKDQRKHALLKRLQSLEAKWEEESEFIPDVGPVLVTRGKYKGRIGYLDDYEYYEKRTVGIVYWGDMYLCGMLGDAEIDIRYLTNTIPTMYLLERINQLEGEIGQQTWIIRDYRKCTSLLLEFHFDVNLLNERFIRAMYSDPREPYQVFISHATADMTFAKALATDLTEAGYQVFLDDWSIDLGENLWQKIGEGITQARYLIPIISKNFMRSVFCLDEWSSFYAKFSVDKQNGIMPVIIDDSEVPMILASRKYFKLVEGHQYDELLLALNRAMKHQEVTA